MCGAWKQVQPAPLASLPGYNPSCERNNAAVSWHSSDSGALAGAVCGSFPGRRGVAPTRLLPPARRAPLRHGRRDHGLQARFDSDLPRPAPLSLLSFGLHSGHGASRRARLRRCPHFCSRRQYAGSLPAPPGSSFGRSSLPLRSRTSRFQHRLSLLLNPLHPSGKPDTGPLSPWRRGMHAAG